MTNQGLFCISTSFIISISFKLKSDPTIVTRYCMHPIYVVSGAGMALPCGWDIWLCHLEKNNCKKHGLHIHILIYFKELVSNNFPSYKHLKKKECIQYLIGIIYFTTTNRNNVNDPNKRKCLYHNTNDHNILHYHNTFLNTDKWIRASACSSWLCPWSCKQLPTTAIHKW